MICQLNPTQHDTRPPSPPPKHGRKVTVEIHEQRVIKGTTSKKIITPWALEIASAVLSLACLAGLITFLYSIDNKPYNSWYLAHVELTPNTILSFLSTICRACFLLCIAEGISQLKWNHFQQRQRRLIEFQHFDSASRGQLGALRLLWSINCKAKLACIGAVVSVLAIATDPLTNQVINIRTRLTIAKNATAAIPSAATYALQSSSKRRFSWQWEGAHLFNRHT
jgi:hypothetical protein